MYYLFVCSLGVYEGGGNGLNTLWWVGSHDDLFWYLQLSGCDTFLSVCQLNNNSDLFFANNSLLVKVELYVVGTNFQQNLKVYHFIQLTHFQ